MLPKLKPFIPQEFCLKCQGCCRFTQQDSAWVPCLLEKEVQYLLDKENIPPAFLDTNRKILAITHPSGEGYACPFLDVKDNKCKIYAFRPFECQMYPFLLNFRKKKVILTVDLNCPYVKENIKSKEFQEYSAYLTEFLNMPEQIKILKDNPHILQAYEEVAEVIELKLSDEVK